MAARPDLPKIRAFLGKTQLQVTEPHRGPPTSEIRNVWEALKEKPDRFLAILALASTTRSVDPVAWEEWELVDSDPLEAATTRCICGTPLPKHEYLLRNTRTERVVTVGACCLNKFTSAFRAAVRVVDSNRKFRENPATFPPRGKGVGAEGSIPREAGPLRALVAPPCSTARVPAPPEPAPEPAPAPAPAPAPELTTGTLERFEREHADEIAAEVARRAPLVRDAQEKAREQEAAFRPCAACGMPQVPRERPDWQRFCFPCWRWGHGMMRRCPCGACHLRPGEAPWRSATAPLYLTLPEAAGYGSCSVRA